VARRLKRQGIEFDEVRVPQRRKQRTEILELTGQDWVPVIVDGEEVIHDSHRILEYLSRDGSRGPAAPTE
jgi:glutathione S-transferase